MSESDNAPRMKCIARSKIEYLNLGAIRPMQNYCFGWQNIRGAWRVWPKHATTQERLRLALRKWQGAGCPD